MDEQPHDTSRAVTLFPELYFDILVRLFPGAVFLGLYVLPSLQVPITGVGLVFLVMAAYVLGFVIELGSDAIWHLLVGHWAISRNRRSGKVSLWDDDKIWEWLRALPDRDRLMRTKMMAEKALFQSLMAIASMAVLFVPDGRLPFFHRSFSWAVSHPRIVAMLSAFTMLGCFFRWQQLIFQAMSMRRRALRSPRSAS
jgi:hypothetical protein